MAKTNVSEQLAEIEQSRPSKNRHDSSLESDLTIRSLWQHDEMLEPQASARFLVIEFDQGGETFVAVLPRSRGH